MIKITVDLREATEAEAKAYARSRTRQFLLYATAQDLAGQQLTIRHEPGRHVKTRQLTAEESELLDRGLLPEVFQPDDFPPERSGSDALRNVEQWLRGLPK